MNIGNMSTNQLLNDFSDGRLDGSADNVMKLIEVLSNIIHGKNINNIDSTGAHKAISLLAPFLNKELVKESQKFLVMNTLC